MMQAQALRSLLLFFLCLLFACAAPQRVSEGRFQKRHHTRGWHVDLHRHTKERVAVAQRVESRMVSATALVTPGRVREASVDLTASADPPIKAGALLATPARIVPLVSPHTRPIGTTRTDMENGTTERTDRRRLEPLSYISFISFMLGHVLLFAAGGGPWTLLILAGFIMALVALPRMHRNGTGGRGFAIVTVVLFAVELLIILILALTWSGLGTFSFQL